MSSNADYISNRFNKYFVDIGANMASNIHDTITCYEDSLSKESWSEMTFELIHENTASALISDLKHKSSYGHDGIIDLL